MFSRLVLRCPSALCPYPGESVGRGGGEGWWWRVREDGVNCAKDADAFWTNLETFEDLDRYFLLVLLVQNQKR